MPQTLPAATESSLAALRRASLITDSETDAVRALSQNGAPLAEYVPLAETLHLHIKVDDTNKLPINSFFDAGARLDYQNEGFVKYLFPGGINAIFSHIKVSQDELIETEETRRPRPFLDHIGIDLRDETEAVRAAFDALPGIADRLGWPVASQGGGGTPVYCCHVEVSEKHWLYPPDDSELAGVPLEFAYGELKVNPSKMGCDLRPGNPAKFAGVSVPCCGTAAHPEDTHAAETSAAGYYDPKDLAKFGQIARVNPQLGDGFFAYYSQVMEDGKLTRREKALIALSLAHALKCPYCIDAYTSTLSGIGVTEAEMNEAVHVAAAIQAGITLVHSVQMMNKLDAGK